MTAPLRTYQNGSIEENSGGGGGGDGKITASVLFKIGVAVSGTVLTVLFTRWLDHVDDELSSVKASIVEIRKEAALRAESWARMEGKLDFYFQREERDRNNEHKGP